jgi:hypothetical protein
MIFSRDIQSAHALALQRAGRLRGLDAAALTAEAAVRAGGADASQTIRAAQRVCSGNPEATTILGRAVTRRHRDGGEPPA